MRVTSNMQAAILTGNLFRNTEQLLKLQDTVSTGKQLRKASEDPMAMTNLLEYRSTLASIGQFERNIDQGKNRVELTETTLETVGELIHMARGIAMDQAAGDLDTRSVTPEEVKNIYDQLMQLANTKIGGNYLFAGMNADSAPFSRDGAYTATYSGDTGDIAIIIGENISLKVNAHGGDLFTGESLPGGVNVFDTLRDLIGALEQEPYDPEAVSVLAQELDQADLQVQNVRAGGAAAYDRLKIAENHWGAYRNKVEQMISGIEDADMTKAIVELQTMETFYEAALAAGSKIIQTSLMDFLR